MTFGLSAEGYQEFSITLLEETTALGANNLAQGVYISTSYKDMVEKLPELAKRLTAENPDLKIIVDKFDSGPPVEAAVEYSIDGPDIDILKSS